MSSDISDYDKLAVLELIIEGFSTEDIASAMPGVTTGSIAAFRAHVTRGTYQELYGTFVKITKP